MSTTTLAERLHQVALLAWGEKIGLVVADGHGVRDNPKYIVFGFCFMRLGYLP